MASPFDTSILRVFYMINTIVQVIAIALMAAMGFSSAVAAKLNSRLRADLFVISFLTLLLDVLYLTLDAILGQVGVERYLLYEFMTRAAASAFTISAILAVIVALLAVRSLHRDRTVKA